LVSHPDEATKQEELQISQTLEEVLVLNVLSEQGEVSTEEVSEVVVSQVSPTVIIQREESVSEEVPVAPSSSSEPTQSTKTDSSPNIKWREIESISPPPIDIIELEDCYHIYAEVPGLSVKDISIDLSNNKFTLTGDKRDHPLLSNSPVKAGDVVVRQEINKKGRFKRVLELPENVDPSDVNVTYEEGMLQFKIRKIVEEVQEDVNEKDEEKEKETPQAESELEGGVNKEGKEGASKEEEKEEVVKQDRKKNKKTKKRPSCLVQ